tara:strand:- start:4844 stop:5212 length:369 start_codon:yes stop_codon:yes gene_type:complete
MKQLLTLLLLGISSICYSQDTLQIPSSELEEFFLALDTLQTQDSIKTIYISNLETELVLLKNLTTQDSLLLSYKNQEVQLLNEQIELYDKRLNQVDKWYNKPWIGVVGTILFLNVVDYTLPK